MKIYLVRHGQTLFNQQKKVQGWCDSPLTQEGIQQAIAVSKTLQSIPFEYAYSSTSERAMDTMHYILQDRDVPYAYVKKSGMLQKKHWHKLVFTQVKNIK